MKLRATFDRGYLKRYLLMAAVGLGWAAYCAYDGLIAYPKKYEIAAEYLKLETLVEQEKLDSASRTERWHEIAIQHGWSLAVPKTAEEVRNSINQQYFMGVIGLFIGLPALYTWFTSRNSWIERTATGIQTSWGQSIDFASVRLLNKRKWKSKGIARAEYDDSGKHRIFEFDDFKFERAPLGKILRELEATLSDAQIVEGTRESVPEHSGESAIE